MERGTEADGAAGVAERLTPRRDLSEVRGERRTDVPLAAQPRPRAQGVGRTGTQSLVGGLQKRVEELERALGRKALVVDVLKKAFELKGFNSPEGTYGG